MLTKRSNLRATFATAARKVKGAGYEVVEIKRKGDTDTLIILAHGVAQETLPYRLYQFTRGHKRLRFLENVVAPNVFSSEAQWKDEGSRLLNQYAEVPFVKNVTIYDSDEIL